MTTPHDSWATIYDFAYEKTFGTFYSNLTKLTLKVIEEELSVNKKIVDFGAGTGRLTIPLSNLGYDVTAVDPSAEMLRVLGRKDPENMVIVRQSYIQNFTSIIRYDFALCVFSVLIYLTTEPDLDRAILAIRNCLKPKGRVLMDIPLLAAFSDLKHSSPTLIRNVLIDKSQDVFVYKESIDALIDDTWINYSDTFGIKCWSAQMIVDKMISNGFEVRKDLSDRFAGSGAHYLLFELE